MSGENGSIRTDFRKIYFLEPDALGMTDTPQRIVGSWGCARVWRWMTDTPTRLVGGGFFCFSAVGVGGALVVGGVKS